MMNSEEKAQLLFECRHTLSLVLNAVTQNGWSVSTSSLFNGDLCRVHVQFPAGTDYHNATVTVPMGIPGNRGTEADGTPSVFRVSIIRVDGRTHATYIHHSTGAVLARVNAWRQSGTPESLIPAFGVMVTD